MTDPLSDDARVALTTVLEPGEEVANVVTAVGCTLVLTDRQLVLVRDGANFRPRTGIRRWPLDRALSIRLTPARRAIVRLLIEREGTAASVFVSEAQTRDANELIMEVRRRIYADT